jgi:hypothetical protein
MAGSGQMLTRFVNLYAFLPRMIASLFTGKF